MDSHSLCSGSEKKLCLFCATAGGWDVLTGPRTVDEKTQLSHCLASICPINRHSCCSLRWAAGESAQRGNVLPRRMKGGGSVSSHEGVCNSKPRCEQLRAVMGYGISEPSRLAKTQHIGPEVLESGLIRGVPMWPPALNAFSIETKRTVLGEKPRVCTRPPSVGSENPDSGDGAEWACLDAGD